MTTLGKYQLLSELGHGGFGTVFLARDTTLDVERAVKVLHPALVAAPEFIERFRREGRFAARLDHPHIVPVHELGEAQGNYYLAMKYVPGGSLKDWLTSHGRLPFADALEITRQVADALAYAQEQPEKLIHRDLKPGNILFDRPPGDPKGLSIRLSDFGFAKALAEAGNSVSSSASGGMLGTPAYMAPEVWRGKPPASPATDQYALACVLYEMLTGEVLFRGDSPPEVITRHVIDGPQFPESWPHGVPADIEAVLRRALAAKPEERYADAPAFHSACAGLLSREAENRAARQQAEKAAAEQAARELERERAALAARESALKAAEEGKNTPEQEERAKRQRESSRKALQDLKQKNSSFSLGDVPGWIWVLILFVVLVFLSVSRGFGGGAPVATQAPINTEIPATATFEPTLAPTETPVPPTATSIPPTAILNIGSTQISEKDGMTLLYVPAGEFTMGSEDGDDDEKPVHTVSLDAFWIDQTEVTNAMFQEFVRATSYQTNAEKSGKSDVFNLSSKQWEETSGADWQHPQGPDSDLSGLSEHPVVHVSWNDASAYCEWAGRRLPTEAEWEKAARGTDGRTYPWGKLPPAGNLVNFADVNLNVDYADKNVDDGYQFTAPVGSYPADVSSYGAYDMAGNAWEWVQDWYGESYYQNSSSVNPQGPASGEYRALRGGSWQNYGYDLRAANRNGAGPGLTNVNIGFRCALWR